MPVFASSRTIALVTILVLMLYPHRAHAQSGTPNAATITGTVQRSDGSPIVSAAVQLIGETDLTSRTNESGAFVFANVPYGNYRVVVNVSGLAHATREHINVAGDLNVSIRYESASVNGLRVIASVSANNRAQIS